VRWNSPWRDRTVARDRVELDLASVVGHRELPSLEYRSIWVNRELRHQVNRIAAVPVSGSAVSAWTTDVSREDKPIIASLLSDERDPAKSKRSERDGQKSRRSILSERPLSIAKQNRRPSPSFAQLRPFAALRVQVCSARRLRRHEGRNGRGRSDEEEPR
jgi:hypothetical protein